MGENGIKASQPFGLRRFHATSSARSRRTQEDYSWLRQLPFGSRFARSVGKADTSNRETGISARHKFGVLPTEHDELSEEGGSHRLRQQNLI